MRPPKRLFNVVDMKVEMYDDIQNIEEHGYIAISHVWGDQEMHTAADLGITTGVDWPVPLSDRKKMNRLKNAMMVFEYKYCWFDVLCMPQDKQDEINLEIPFMGGYYSGAAMTLALSDVEYAMSEDFIKWYIMLGDAVETGRELTFPEMEWLIGWADNGKDDLLDISKDQWFMRVWTLQEVILSKVTILVGANGCNINLSNVIRRLSYASSMNIVYNRVFGAGVLSLLGISNLVDERRNGTLDLSRVMHANSSRNCYRIHDRFYGVLGILDYTNVLVDYNLDIDILNKLVIQYAYSKGDISWMAVGGHRSTGFIQPMYNGFPSAGRGWIEDRSGVCNVAFYENTMKMNAMLFGQVVRCERYSGSDDDLGECIAWTIKVLRNWGIDDSSILQVMMGYIELYQDLVETGKSILDAVARDGSMFGTIASLAVDEDEFNRMATILSRLSLNTSTYRWTTFLVQVHIPMVNQMCPLIVSGEANVGDWIVIPRVHDGGKRNLGIVVHETSIRKGTCIVPQIKMSEERKNLYFTPHWFPL
ncbi:hypothetical protein BGZ98_008232 [Dissophora globulifera]|nr:hypothetical protein BGZ98_008232 [Dissophora globulifera]